MRFYLLFSLAFISGIQGFIIFAPYVLAVAAVGQLFSRRRATGTTGAKAIAAVTAVTVIDRKFAVVA